jgi:hypothetical protein
MKHELLFHFRVLRHFFLSRSKFGIHSPFVYRIYSEILKDKTDYQEYNTIREKMIVADLRVSSKSFRLLFRLSRYFNPKTILSTVNAGEICLSCLALGSPRCHIINFSDNPGSPADSGLTDMVFISGEHQKDVILDYFFRILQHIHNDSVMIFCKINVPGGMHEAWKEIKNHSSVTVTIDLFDLGLVFCKEELTKEDFVLRY